MNTTRKLQHEDVPPDIYRKVKEIESYFANRGIMSWAYCGIQSRAQRPVNGVGAMVEQGRYQLICSNGCGQCGLMLREFETSRTETDDGVVIDRETTPDLVSTCCGHEVEIWDQTKDEVTPQKVRAVADFQIHGERRCPERRLREALSAMGSTRAAELTAGDLAHLVTLVDTTEVRIENELPIDVVMMPPRTGMSAGVAPVLPGLIAAATPQQPAQAPQTTDQAIAPMTAHRAAFFMERFAREEKLLGPNEQAAVAFVIAMLEAQPAQAPIDMVLHCPKCHTQHIDEPDTLHVFDGKDAAGNAHVSDVGSDGGWNNPPHRSHLCHGCGHIWRPADVPTNGVAAVKTAGKNDSPVAQPAASDRDARYAELGRIAMQFVDRAGDVHPGIDGAENICADFYAAMQKTIDAAEARAGINTKG